MKKAQTPKKLSLHRETVRHLETLDLREVRGAHGPQSQSHSGEDCCITVITK